MTKFSLRQAADQVGVSKSTILRAIQNGKLSAPRTDGGRYAIDPAELFRVYGDRTTHQADDGAEGQDAPPAGSADFQSQIENLQYQIDLLLGRIDDLETQVKLARQIQLQTAQSMMYAKRRGLFDWLFDRQG